jgi:hypothetical protein
MKLRDLINFIAPPSTRDLDIPDDAQSAIDRGDAADVLVGSPGWKLLLDEFELIADEYLGKLREVDSDAQSVLVKKLRWEIAEQILGEIQTRMAWHRELRDQIIKETQDVDTRGGHPDTNEAPLYD